MEKFLCINNTCTDPYFNLAMEEYLLKNKGNNIFMLWSNRPVVVVGKHQNIQAEINQDFITENNILAARRLSGGGTVYHDEGNLNFTYIMNAEPGKMVDFVKYTNDILQFLNEQGAGAERNQRNDLLINGKKISGNAEHIFKQRVLHHGTLLFDSDLDILEKSIKVKAGNYNDKAVQSVRSKVCNIAPFLNAKININDFRNSLLNFVLNCYPNSVLYELQESEKDDIREIVSQKYSTWEWIYGYSPKYSLDKNVETDKGLLKIYLEVQKGLISGASFSGKMLDSEKIQVLQKCLVGHQHDKSQLLNILNRDIHFNGINLFTAKEFVDYIF